jgi:hypothetical protein
MLNDLTKQKHRSKIGVAIIIVTILSVAYFGGIGFQSMFSWREVYIKDSSGDVVNSGDTIFEEDGLYLEAFDIEPEALRDCNLYLSVDNTLVSEGMRTTPSAHDFVWTFDLSNVYKGTYGYYLETVEDDAWVSYVFYIVGDTDSPDLIPTPPPELILFPDDRSVQAGDEVDLIWSVKYEGSADVEIYVDGGLVETMDHIGSESAKTYEYTFSSVIIGVFTIEFNFIPEGSGELKIVDEVPDDISFDVDESPANVEWTFSYDGACVVDVEINGVWDEGKTYSASTDDQTFIYDVDTSVEGIYEIVFIVTPGTTDNPIVSDTLSVAVGELSTTTTTTTGVPPPPEEPDYMFLVIGVAAVIIIGIVMLKRRNEYYG